MVIPTTIEQSTTLYSLTDNTIVYWVDWLKKFIDFCINTMGWEVVSGPGTSYGAFMPSYVYMSYGSSYWNTYAYKSAGWDCDWTQPNGIVDRWKDSTYNNHPLYTGWFYDYSTWQPSNYDYGIDESCGRFDTIIYMTGNDTTNEKIGIRIKFPLCSVGYAVSGRRNTWNYIYTVPGVSVYSSTRGNIEYKYPTDDSGYRSLNDLIDDATEHYINIFSKFSNGLNSVIYTDETTEEGDISDENNISPLFTYEYQKERIKGDINNRAFYYYWHRFNRVNYHISKDGYTTYFYIHNGSDIGFKIIITELENGEKAIIIDRRNTQLNQGLCEQIIVASNAGTQNSVDNSILIRAPLRPYRGVTSQINRFAISRMLIPNHNVLCKDLYYIKKRDITDSIKDGQYIMVKDNNKASHYFRVIPFGSATINETVGDNTTLLAFPIKDPTEEDEDNE